MLILWSSGDQARTQGSKCSSSFIANPPSWIIPTGPQGEPTVHVTKIRSNCVLKHRDLVVPTSHLLIKSYRIFEPGGVVGTIKTTPTYFGK